MTIAIAGNFPEGVIFGADSAVSYVNMDGQGISQTYDGAQKIYHLGSSDDCSDSPYGAMLFGSCQFEGFSWRNIFARFSRQLVVDDYSTASEAVQGFVSFLDGLQPDQQARPKGGVFFTGYGEKDEAVKCFKISMDTLDVLEIESGDVQFDGMPIVADRLRHGVDQGTIEALECAFGGLTVEVTDDHRTETRDLLSMILEVLRGNSFACMGDLDMPLRDAIDYVHFLVYSTIKHFKFNHCAPVCGGKVELAAITLDRGFRRIRRKPLDSQMG